MNAILPFDLKPDSKAKIRVEKGGIAGDAVPIQINPAVPSLFTYPNQQGRLIALNRDGSLNSSSNPAPAGSIVTVFATGLGQMNPPGY